MRAAWYDRQGPSSVLEVGELPTPEPGEGEVRVHLTRSGINPAVMTDSDRPTLPFSPMRFQNTTIHLIGSDDFPLEKIAEAHDAGDGGALHGRILLSID